MKSKVHDLQISLSISDQSPNVEGPFKKLDGPLLEIVAYYASSPYSTLSQLSKYTYELFSGPELLKRLLEQRFSDFPKFALEDLAAGSELAKEIRSILKEYRYKNSINLSYIIWSEFLRKGKYPNLARIMFNLPHNELDAKEKQFFKNALLRKYMEMASFDDIYNMDIEKIDDNTTSEEFNHNKYAVYLLQNPDKKILFNEISASNLREMIYHGLFLDAPIEYYTPLLVFNGEVFYSSLMNNLLMKLAMEPSIDPSIYNKLKSILDSMVISPNQLQYFNFVLEIIFRSESECLDYFRSSRENIVFSKHQIIGLAEFVALSNYDELFFEMLSKYKRKPDWKFMLDPIIETWKMDETFLPVFRVTFKVYQYAFDSVRPLFMTESFIKLIFAHYEIESADFKWCKAILKANPTIYSRYGLPEYLTYTFRSSLLSPSSLEEGSTEHPFTKTDPNHYAKATMLQDLLVEFDYFVLKKWSSWVPSYMSGDFKISPEQIQINLFRATIGTVKFANIEAFTNFLVSEMPKNAEVKVDERTFNYFLQSEFLRNLIKERKCKFYSIGTLILRQFRSLSLDELKIIKDLHQITDLDANKMIESSSTVDEFKRIEFLSGKSIGQIISAVCEYSEINYFMNRDAFSYWIKGPAKALIASTRCIYYLEHLRRDFPKEMVEIDEIIEKRKHEAAKRAADEAERARLKRERLSKGSLGHLFAKYMKKP